MTPYIIERAERVLVLEQALIKHRKRSSSITTTLSEQNAFDWLFAVKEKEKFIINRTPTIFSQQLKAQFDEMLFRDLIVHYSIFYTHIEKSHPFWQNEIQMHAIDIKKYNTMTRLLYAVYKISPLLCNLYLRCCHLYRNC